MCLLVTQPEGTIFNDDFLKGVYHLNSDGIGVMYAENNVLHSNKYVPHTEADFLKFFKDHIEGRACAWHARMRTHGDIDLTNCHPYVVMDGEDGYPLFLMHNGVLSSGNKADLSKSDTWHYIEDKLRPLLLKFPELFLEDSFQELIEEHIGSNNKFVMLDAYGNMVTLNKSKGVEYNGAWLSNTYAWDTTGTEFDYKSRWTNYRHTGYNATGAWGGYDDEGYSLASASHSNTSKTEATAKSDQKNETGVTKRAAGSDPNQYFEYDETEDSIEFANILFETATKVGLDHDGIQYEAAIEYYFAVGYVDAWDFIDDIVDENVSQADFVNELLYYSIESYEYSPQLALFPDERTLA